MYKYSSCFQVFYILSVKYLLCLLFVLLRHNLHAINYTYLSVRFDEFWHIETCVTTTSIKTENISSALQSSLLCLWSHPPCSISSPGHQDTTKISYLSLVSTSQELHVKWFRRHTVFCFQSSTQCFWYSQTLRVLVVCSFAILCMDTPKFVIHSPTDGHLGCFHFGGIMNKAASNIHIQVWCGHMLLVFRVKYVGVEWLGYMALACLP